MQSSWILLRIIGTAVVQIVGENLAKRHISRYLPEVAYFVWEAWGKHLDEKTRTEEIEATARPMGKVRPYIEIIVQDIAGNQSEEIRKLLITYLSVVPSTIRLALRRPMDPKGMSIPPWLVPRDAEDLLVFLPTQIPIFEPGDRPLTDVDWELTDLLGVGGFGEVWRAQNPTFQSVPGVVLKFCIDTKGSNKAFRHEAAILTQAMPHKPHPGLVELRATYMNAKTPALEFEYIAGGDLLQWFKGRKRAQAFLSTRSATKIVLRLAKIVGHFHRRKPPIVHRDLKPANILVRNARGKRMEFKICDFGIGGLASNKTSQGNEEITSRRLIKRSAMKGWHTPMYASPQQIKGGPPDPRDDVHALGVIWYQLLMNDLSLPAPTGLDWIEDLVRHHQVNREQVELLASCFQSRAELRPADAGVLCQEIRTRFAVILKAPSKSAPKSDKPSTPEPKTPDTGKGLVGRLKFWS